MPVKMTIVPNWSGKLHQGLQAGLLEMTTDIDKRAKILAPKDTRALINSGRIAPSRASDTYTVTYGSSQVPYARRQHFEHRTKSGYLAKAGEAVARGNTAKYFSRKIAL